MVTKGSSASFRWSLVLWAGLLLNTLAITLGRYRTLPDLQMLLSSSGIVLDIFYFWAIVKRRCPTRTVSYTPRERIVLMSLFALNALLLAVFFLPQANHHP
jgi:hypothetical protein